MIRMSESIDALAADLALAQGEFMGAEREARGNFGAYATLASVWEACRPALARHGLCVVQSPGLIEDKQLVVTSLLIHKSGQYLADEFSMPLPNPTPQGTGSAITYARRYSLMALLGIAPEDDDGQAAQPEPRSPRLLTAQETAILNCKEARERANVIFHPKNVAAAIGITPEAAQALFTEDGKLRYRLLDVKSLNLLTYYATKGQVMPKSSESNGREATDVGAGTEPDPAGAVPGASEA